MLLCTFRHSFVSEKFAGRCSLDFVQHPRQKSAWVAVYSKNYFAVFSIGSCCAAAPVLNHVPQRKNRKHSCHGEEPGTQIPQSQSNGVQTGIAIRLANLRDAEPGQDRDLVSTISARGDGRRLAQCAISIRLNRLGERDENK